MRWILRAFLCLAAVLPEAVASGGPPNILLIVSDDQRPDAIGAFDHPDLKTPTLDRLVERGVVFRDAYCMGSDVGAVCRPSRAMLLSGRSLYRAPRDLNDVVTLPEQFRQAGYETFGTGKWHNGQESFVRSFSRGGAVFFGGMGDPLRLPVFDYDATAAKPLSNKHPSGTHAETLFADETIRFLGERNRDQPFFAYVSFTSPHDPRTPPPEFAAMYDPDEIELPENFLPEHPFDNGEMKIRDEQLADWPRTPEAVRKHLADYYAMISHVDHEVGRILAALERAGDMSGTYVIFTSDHGLAIGSHGLLGKQNLYEHSMKTPLIVAGPRLTHRDTDALVYLFDLYPTLCDLAGIEAPKGLEGRSLVPILRGESTGVRQAIFTAYGNVQRALRTDRWKLISYPQIERLQLFDLKTDPHEMNNVAEAWDYAQHLATMKKGLEIARQRYGDPLDSPAPAGVSP